MKIVLSGVETNNKGAELMLYAILQEIERRFPDAEVYLPYYRIAQGTKYVHTNLKFRTTPWSAIVAKLRVPVILYKLKLYNESQAIIAETSIVKDADWFIDGSGFAFGDQWNIKDSRIRDWELKLQALHDSGCKVVFLPQAFGPVEKEGTKKAFTMLNKYANLIMPREQVSYDYVRASGLIDMNKVKKFTDFTSLVEGVFPEKYSQLRNGICIIPNMQMIRMGKITYEDYIKLLSALVNEGKRSGLPIYLLNHEGKQDEELCIKCKESIGGDIEAVTGLNALEVKGLIGTAKIVITSRFHGLASALNSGVPSLATSWSHKYEELFRDYGLEGYVLPLNDIEKAVERVGELLDEKENQRLRNHLAQQIPLIKAQTKEMWECVWAIE